MHVQREEGERGRGTRTQWDQFVTQTSQVVPGIASQVPLPSETQPNVDTDRHVTAPTHSTLGSSASPVPIPSTHVVSRRQGVLACVSPRMVRIVGSMCFQSLSFAVFSVSGRKETAITYSTQTPVPYCQRSLVAKCSARV